MRVLIIEDDQIAIERLKKLLKEYDGQLELMACLNSIEEPVSWLKTNKYPDILLLNIQLQSGLSFEILKRINGTIPVIFTATNNEYVFEALKYFCIDYLLKPVSFSELQTALEKHRQITTHFVDNTSTLKAVKNVPPMQYKERFLVKLGQRLTFVKTTDIAYFKADDKVVSLVDNQGNKFLIDHTLEKLETLLDPRYFFRLNRKVIVAIDSIAHIKPYSNSRLLLFLKDGHKNEELIISRERVPEFRQWAEG